MSASAKAVRKAIKRVREKDPAEPSFWKSQSLFSESFRRESRGFCVRTTVRRHFNHRRQSRKSFFFRANSPERCELRRRRRRRRRRRKKKMTKKNFLSSTLKTSAFFFVRYWYSPRASARSIHKNTESVFIYLFIYLLFIYSFIHFSVFLFYNLPSPNSLRDEDPKCPIFGLSFQHVGLLKNLSLIENTMPGNAPRADSDFAPRTRKLRQANEGAA